jgi:hypothetical protein
VVKDTHHQGNDHVASLIRYIYSRKMISSQNNIDPTVVDATYRGLIESYAGTSLKDASKEEMEFLVSQSKSAGNMLFKDKKYKGKDETRCTVTECFLQNER